MIFTYTANDTSRVVREFVLTAFDWEYAEAIAGCKRPTIYQQRVHDCISWVCACGRACDC